MAFETSEFLIYSIIALCKLRFFSSGNGLQLKSPATLVYNSEDKVWIMADIIQPCVVPSPLAMLWQGNARFFPCAMGGVNVFV
jgi:hypothetical protein